MESVSVSELKARLSHYLRSVRFGGEVQIVDRGVPVALLVGLKESDDDIRQRLLRSGAVRPATEDMKDMLSWPPVAPGADLLGSLQEEREDRM